jgi:hypothetical protein
MKMKMEVMTNRHNEYQASTAKDKPEPRPLFIPGNGEGKRGSELRRRR